MHSQGGPSTGTRRAVFHSHSPAACNLLARAGLNACSIRGSVAIEKLKLVSVNRKLVLGARLGKDVGDVVLKLNGCGFDHAKLPRTAAKQSMFSNFQP